MLLFTKNYAIYWIDDGESTPILLQVYLSKTQQVAQLLNQSLFLGLFEFETHFAIYQPALIIKNTSFNLLKLKIEKFPLSII